MPHQWQVLDVHQRKTNSKCPQHIRRDTLAHVLCEPFSEGGNSRYGCNGGAEAHGPRHHGQAGDGGHGRLMKKEGKDGRSIAASLYASTPKARNKMRYSNAVGVVLVLGQQLQSIIAASRKARPS